MTSSRGTLFGVLAIAAWSSYGVLLASNGRTNPVMAAAILFTSGMPCWYPGPMRVAEICREDFPGVT